MSYLPIAVLENEFEAQLLENVLTERQIPHLLKSYHDVAYDGLFQFTHGWGHVSAPGLYREEVLKILADIRQGTG